MAACVAASIAASATGIRGHVEDPKLQNSFAEDILQAYMMAAAKIAAGGDDSFAAPAASVLRQGGVETNAAGSSLSEHVAYVQREQGVVYVDAMPKLLHDLEEIALSPNPAYYTGRVEEGSEYVESDIQKVTEGVIEANFVNEVSTELNKSSERNSANHFEVTSASPSNGTAKGSDLTGDNEASPVNWDGPAETRDTEGTDPRMDANVIARQGVHGSKDGDSATVYTPPIELDISPKLGCANDDDHGEVSDTGTPPAVDLENLEGKSTDVLEDSDTTEVHDILMDKGDVRIRASESRAKVGGLSTRAANIDVVDNIDSVTTVSRSFSFTGLNHVAFCVENLERSLDFYCGLLGLQKNVDRPELPYRGAWLFLGAEGIHLMEVPNPDPVNGRPAHGGYDRHACLNCHNVEGIRLTLEKGGIAYQPSPVPSLFTRDPDGNGLEFIEVES